MKLTYSFHREVTKVPNPKNPNETLKLLFDDCYDVNIHIQDCPSRLNEYIHSVICKLREIIEEENSEKS
jgi:hypothetical protein